MTQRIETLEATEILDSRGNPTVEVTVKTSQGIEAHAMVPSGASTGKYEAFELRDDDPKRYDGKGVLKAVNNVNTILNEAVHGYDVFDQEKIDRAMIDLDGTENKQKIGANAILGVSLAVSRAAAQSHKVPLYRYIRSLVDMKDDTYTLPTPLMNVINGGMHASTNINIQEFWVIPHAAPTFRERLRQGGETFHALGRLLTGANMDTDLGDEGGYAPNFGSHEQVFELLLEAIAAAGLVSGDEISLGIDAGASVFYDKNSENYELALERQSFTADEFIEYLSQWARQYPIIAMEDPLDEEAWTDWQKLTVAIKKINPAVRIIGDDLFVTNTDRLQQGIDGGAADSILIKLNQTGTLTETLETIMLAQQNAFSTVISHRSGETSDHYIADLAVAVNAEFVKMGSTARSERTAKYNRLLMIEKELYGQKS